MSSTLIEIKGNIWLDVDSKPIRSLQVDLYATTQNIGWIAGTQTDSNGYYIMYFDDTIANPINLLSPDLELRVKYGDTLIHTEPIESTIASFVVNIPILAANYENAISDRDPELPSEPGYIFISGTLVDINNFPLSARIKINESKFRASSVLAITQSDEFGYYKVKVSSKYLRNSSSSKKRALSVVAVVIDEEELETVIAGSVDFFDFGTTLEVNLKALSYIDADNTEYDRILVAVTTIVDTVDIENITVSEFDYIAGVTGYQSDQIRNLVSAHKTLLDYEINEKAIYGILSQNTNNSVDHILSQDFEVIETQLSMAIGKNIIPSVEFEGAVYDAILEYKAGKLRDARNVAENLSNGEILSSILPLMDIDFFFKTYVANKNSSANDFWGIYTEALSGDTPEEDSQRLQTVIKLIRITGFQPAMSLKILNSIEGSSKPLSSIGRMDLNDWKDLIGAETEPNIEETVPKVFWNYEGWEPATVKTNYATYLLQTSQQLYPTQTLGKLLEDDDEDTIITGTLVSKINEVLDSVFTIEEIKNSVIDFINENTEFNLRVSSIYEISSEVDNHDALVLALAPFQRVFRIVGGNPEAVAQFVAEGMDSATAMVRMGRDAFIAAYYLRLGGPIQASMAFDQAEINTAVTAHAAAGLHTYKDDVSMDVIGHMYPWLDAPSDVGADLSTMFGSLDQCCCEECRSVYSPAAYFTDIMNFVFNTGSATPPSEPYTELDRRRPDLKHVDLTCKNANTPLPYIDLVNEQLEMMILDEMSITIPESYQTNGEAKEIAAYPEHLVKDAPSVYSNYTNWTQVYDSKLNDEETVYPLNLPFHLAVEESRVFLKHLGSKRYDVMKLYRPYQTPATSSELNELDIESEYFGILRIASLIIQGAHPTIPGSGGTTADNFPFYGFGASSATIVDPSDSTLNISGTWSTILEDRVDVLVHQLNITFNELMQLLTTDHLNKQYVNMLSDIVRPIEIVSKSWASPDTCKLNELEFQFTTPTYTYTFLEFLDRLHRHVRFCKATGISIYQLDSALRYLDADTITDTNYLDLLKLFRISKELNLGIDQIASWFNGTIDIYDLYRIYDCKGEGLIPSIYDQLFRNKAVLNPVDVAFNDPTNFTSPAVHYEDHFPVLMSAFKLSEDDTILILDALSVTISANVTLLALGKIHAVSSLIRSVNISMREFIRICAFLEIDLTSNPDFTFENYQKIIIYASKLRNSGFQLVELEYLLLDIDADSSFKPIGKDIVHFQEQMHKNLKTVLATGGTDVMELIKNSILSEYSSQFQLSADITKYLLGEKLEITYGLSGSTTSEFVLTALTNDPDYVWITENNPFDPTFWVEDTLGSTPKLVLHNFYDIYRLLNKIAFIVNRFKLSKDELKVLIDASSDLNITDPITLPIDTVSTSVYLDNLNKFLNYIDWIKVRDILGIEKSAFVDFIDNVYISKTTYLSKLVEITGWDTGFVEAVVGESATLTDAGNLKVDYSADFINGELVLRISQISNLCARIGLDTDKIMAVLESGVTIEEANNTRKAAKAKHSESTWLKLAKPLQDVLREKQREALVSYIVSRPSTVTFKRWRNENELYAYLLMDVEMKPLMMTSRIKQAICSIQLYVDRVIMNMEYKNGNPADGLVTMTPDTIKQWKTWRKWYRIWEANRKIFLYPENWIEPELRDNKSPFYEELETRLLQDDVNETLAENAYMEYLEKLDEVARLEPVTTVDQLVSGTGTEEVPAQYISHFFSRTYAHPHKYFYRVRKNLEYTPWEPINLEIKGEQVTAYFDQSSGRLYLFWLTFIEKSKTITAGKNFGKKDTSSLGKYNWLGMHELIATSYKNIKSISHIESNPLLYFPDFKDIKDRQEKYLDITLNWSEFKDGKWLAQKLSKETISISPSQILLTEHNKNNITKEYFAYLTQKSDMPLMDFFKSRIYIKASADSDNSRYVSLYLPTFFNEKNGFLHGFHFKDMFGQPEVMIYERLNNSFMSPQLTLQQNQQFVLNKIEAQTIGFKLLDTFATEVDEEMFSYVNSIDSDTSNDFPMGNNVMVNTPPSIILGNIPHLPGDDCGKFYLALSSNFNMMYPLGWSPFHYSDDKSIFYVRVVKELVPIEPIFTPMGHNGGIGTPSTLTHDFETKYRYLFETFYHPHVHHFKQKLYNEGLDAMLELSMQDQTDTLNFGLPGGNRYAPTPLVHPRYPKNIVNFGYDDAYSCYNWELFFHIPMLIANRLSENQKFEEAQKWYHYIFNPTSNVDDSGNIIGEKKRFWRFRPFYLQAGFEITSISDIMEHINDHEYEINNWMNNPFKPHAVARLRIVAYMKNVVMKYLDNLIAWGDQLFRRDTIESINEATNLYVLASNILGIKPQDIPPRTATLSQTFEELRLAGLDLFSNAMVNIESFIGPNAAPAGTGIGTGPLLQMLYFCIPRNEKIHGYWKTIADRLFKIRNSMNIDGKFRTLPLYEPPIDPALLVRAVAAGIDMNSILDSVGADGSPHYRFAYMLQKSNELCNDVKSLGGALLSALEKKDAEEIALIRSTHELNLLEKVKSVKEAQVRESESALESLKKTKLITEYKYHYYSTRPFLNSGEKEHLKLQQVSNTLQIIQGSINAVTSVLAAVPQVHGQVPASVGSSFGGQHLATAMQGASAVIGINASALANRANIANLRGGFDRRQDDWTFQTETAKIELEQIENQLLAAEIRLEIVNTELNNHIIQMENSQEVDSYMRSKFTNKQLYSWMVSQISTTYFQTYQLAYDLAKKTEKSYLRELPIATLPAGGYVKFGYWDSLKKGLLAGEKLQFDLRKMELNYMDENRREMELTKHFSLGLIDPEALMTLKSSGTCSFSLTEPLYDLDFPGHSFRRIKSVSISIPCIAGPYTMIPATLTLLENRIVTDDTIFTAGSRDIIVDSNAESISTSSSQNDSGVFDLNFRDERYVPFENKGAISDWNLSLMDDVDLRQFDYSTISDVIIHMKYTAQDIGTKAGSTKIALQSLTETTNNGFLCRYFSLKHEFANEWNTALNATGSPVLEIPLKHELFPFYCKGKTITPNKIYAQLIPMDNAGSINFTFTDSTNLISLDLNSDQSIDFDNAISGTITPTTPLTLNLSGASVADLEKTRDIFFIINYEL